MKESMYVFMSSCRCKNLSISTIYQIERITHANVEKYENQMKVTSNMLQIECKKKKWERAATQQQAEQSTKFYVMRLYTVFVRSSSICCVSHIKLDHLKTATFHFPLFSRIALFYSFYSLSPHSRSLSTTTTILHVF